MEEMTDEQIREEAIGTVDAVAGGASDYEIEAAIAEISAERAVSDEDRSGE